MSMSNYLENSLLNHVLKGTAYPAPASRYLALFTTNPDEGGTGTEVTGGAYARQVVAFNTSTSGSSTTSADVNFPIATASWGNVSHIGIYDAVTGGNLLFYGALSTPQAVGINNQIIFKAGQLTITLD